MAENVASRVSKGTRVIVTGRLEQRSWETEDGEKRSKVEIVADEIGPSLRWATADGHQERAPRRRLRRRQRWRRRRRRRPVANERRRRRLRTATRSRSDGARQPRKRGKNKDNARRSKKKIEHPQRREQVDYVDYKDVNLLRRFMSDRAKIRARRVTGNDAQQQKEIARAIKNAREMALLPYANRVTTQQRGGRDRGDRGDRGDRRPPRRRPAAASRQPAARRWRRRASTLDERRSLETDDRGRRRTTRRRR